MAVFCQNAPNNIYKTNSNHKVNALVTKQKKENQENVYWLFKYELYKKITKTWPLHLPVSNETIVKDHIRYIFSQSTVHKDSKTSDINTFVAMVTITTFSKYTLNI